MCEALRSSLPFPVDLPHGSWIPLLPCGLPVSTSPGQGMDDGAQLLALGEVRRVLCPLQRSDWAPLPLCPVVSTY